MLLKEPLYFLNIVGYPCMVLCIGFIAAGKIKMTANNTVSSALRIHVLLFVHGVGVGDDGYKTAVLHFL